MIIRSNFFTLVIAVILIATALPASACRYSVREVGFVDLDEAPYHFLIYPGDASEETVARIKRAAYTAFIDCQVLIEEVTDANTNVDYIKRHRLIEFPAGVLVAPEGQSLPISFPAESLEKDDALLDVLKPLATSSKRRALLEKVTGPFCTLLLIHGDDAKLNVTTKARIEAAMAELTENMDNLEKGTKIPPQLLELSAKERSQEIPLLWSLGLSPTDLAQPRVVILFGRARRMGSVLRGDRVTQESLVEIMSLIGASCECGLDRKWMQGPMLLLEWDNTDQADLAKHLGFDPESPLVKTEISQIIAQGMAQSSDTKMDSILGVDEAAGRMAAADVVMEDVLVVEDVPLGGDDALDGDKNVKTIVVDLPDATLHVDMTPVSIEKDNGSLTINLPDVTLGSEKGGSGIIENKIVVTPAAYLYTFIALFVLANIIGATYLYRKKSQQ